jgi:thiosulfate/3-mercaptopyruvate sulfurtransferase
MDDPGDDPPQHRDLIECEELAARLASDDPPVVLDVRWRLGGPPGSASYEASHLPGARFVDLERDLTGPVGDGSLGRHPLPRETDFARVLGRLGVTSSRDVVVYGDRDATSAGRCWWLLRHVGHRSVRVLNGGIAAWNAFDGPLEHGLPASPCSSTVEPWRFGCCATLDHAAAASMAEAGSLIDARSSSRYRGEPNPIDPVAGHIPGAISVPTADCVGADGRFLDAAELAARFSSLGLSRDRPIGVYCGSGITATQTILALRLAGLGDAALYPGSWSHWIADPSRPVARGAAPAPGARR